MGHYVEAEAWLPGPRSYGLRPYRAYVPDLLAGWNPVFSFEDGVAVHDAQLALARIETMPGTSLATSLAGWMAARDESIRTSVMEGVDSTAGGLAWARYRDMAGRPVSDANDALTLGAVKQIEGAVGLGERMAAGGLCSVDDIRELHETLFRGTRDRPIGGVLRDSPIWIGPPGCLIEQASFVAPPSDEVPALMDDLVDYLNTSDHHPIVQAAVAHVQFETIHPFEDGNGRTGRALVQSVLVAQGATRGVVPISTALSRDVAAYHESLRAARAECPASDSASRSKAMRPWLMAFCRACGDAERESAGIARRVAALTDSWRSRASPRSGSAAAALLEALPSMPVFDTAMVADRLGMSPESARTAVRTLARAGIVAAVGGRRHRRYEVPELVDRFRGTLPDGGRPRPGSSPPDGDAGRGAGAAAVLVACGHLGSRSRLRCTLGKGHRGHHRYQ